MERVTTLPADPRLDQRCQAPTRRGGPVSPRTRTSAAARALAATLLIAGCSGRESDLPQSDVSPPDTSTSTSAGAVDGGALVRANGHELYAECIDNPGPTVVFLHGAGGRGSDWGRVLAGLGDLSTCWYDRFNVGSSGQDERRHSPVEAAEDLEALLEESELSPPYVLVGHSWGGLLALIEAGRRPEQVAGLVLVDATLPLETDLDPPNTVTQVQAEMNGFERGLDAYEGYAAARKVQPHLPDVAMTYILGTQQELPSSWPAGAYERKLNAWVSTWDEGRLVRCACGHDIPLEAPDVIEREVRAVVDQAAGPGS